MFFFYIIILFFAIFIFVRFTTIQIHIENIRFTTEKINGRHLNKNYKIEIKLYLFNLIRYFKINITKEKIERKEIRKGMEKLEKKLIANRKNFDLKSINKLKIVDAKIENLNLIINIGLEDAAICAIFIGFISSILAIILRKNEKENNVWKIMPIYQNKNFMSINLDCKINIKLINVVKLINLKKLVNNLKISCLNKIKVGIIKKEEKTFN